MDPTRFDALARALGAGRSRRAALSTLAAGALGGLFGLGAGDSAGATHAGCRHDGKGCARAGQCCSGRCAGNGTCQPCTKAGQCPQPATPCERAVCTSTGKCVIRDKPAGASCGTDKACCGRSCTALGTDDNCGTCNEACAADQTCRGDACEGGCLPLQANCTGAGECCRDLNCGPIANLGQGQCCRPLGGECSNPGGFDQCCAVVFEGGGGRLVTCAPNNTCGGSGARCSGSETCASGVCCGFGLDGECCAAGQRCEGGGCVG